MTLFGVLVATSRQPSWVSVVVSGISRSFPRNSALYVVRPAPTSPGCHYGVAWTVFDYATLRLPRPTVLVAGRSFLLARAMQSFVVIPWPFYKQARQGGPKSGPD